LQEIAFPVENHQRVVAAVENVHAILRIAGRFSLPDGPTVGRLCPIVQNLVGEFSAAYCSHGATSWLGVNWNGLMDVFLCGCTPDPPFSFGGPRYSSNSLRLFG
jgi:hypothetical protein